MKNKDLTPQEETIYHIQIGYTELQKGYTVAWCIDVSMNDAKYIPEQLF
jgi:hypothetical protein